VRGYESSTRWAWSTRYTYDALGGSKRVIGNAELQFPFPGSGKDRSLRWFTFADAGQVYQENQKILPRRAALLGRYRPVVDFPGGPAEVELC
jgi:outer membrane protein insertion porin family